MIFNLSDEGSLDVLRVYLEEVRKRGLRVGLTSGSFDLIHYHHFRYFIQCRRACDILIVGVDSDALVRERKGKGRPLMYDSRRVEMVDQLKSVRFAFVMDSVEDFGTAAEIIRPDIIFKNDSFETREEEILGKEFAKRVVIIQDVKDLNSTTEIIQAAGMSVNGNSQKTT